MGQQEQPPIQQQQYQLPQQYQQPMQQPIQPQPRPIQPIQPVGQQIPAQYQPPQPIQYQQQLQQPQQGPIPQLQPMQFSQQPYLMNQFAHYKFNGTLFSGFKSKFPCELTNVLAKQDFECIIDEVNKVVSYKQRLTRFLLLVMFCSLIAFFMVIPSLLTFLIVFPISTVIFLVSYIFLRKISAKRQDMLGKVVDNFNATFLSRSVSLEIKKKSYSERYNFNSTLKICYPASLSVQPMVYYPQQTMIQQPIQQQPIQQQPIQQQIYQQVVIEQPISESTSLLL